MALPFIVWLFLFRLLPNSGPNLPLDVASASSWTAVASAARHRFSHPFDSTESAVAHCLPVHSKVDTRQVGMFYVWPA